MKKVGGMGSGLSGLTGLSGLSIGGGWTPASPDADGNLPHTGYAPWLLTGIYQDAAGTTPAASDGDPVGNMTNVQMFGTDAYAVVQATSANKPTLRTGANGLDGQPILSLDGGDWLQGNNFGGGAISQPYTVIAIAALDAGSVNTGNNFISDAGNGNTGTLLFQTAATAPNEWAIKFDTRLDGGVSDSNWNIWMATGNGVSSQLWLNGVLKVTGDAGADTANGLTLGARDDGSFKWVGKIAAFFIIDALSSNAVLNQYGAYLQSIFSSLSYTQI